MFTIKNAVVFTSRQIILKFNIVITFENTLSIAFLYDCKFNYKYIDIFQIYLVAAFM